MKSCAHMKVDGFIYTLVELQVNLRLSRNYRYNSGGKKFTEVSTTKHLSVSIDAITIHNHLWQKKPGPGSRR